MGGFVNGVGGNGGVASTSAGEGFSQILTQLASGISENLLGAQNGQAQAGTAQKLDQIISKLEQLLAGLKGDKGANQGAEGAQGGKGAQGAKNKAHNCDAQKAKGAEKAGANEKKDPISQLKSLINQLVKAGLLSKGQAKKILAKLDEMQAKQGDAAQGGDKAGDKAGEENSIIQQLEQLIAELKDKIGGAKAKQDGDSCCCADAENAGSFMDNAGKADYASMVEKNKAA